MDRFEEVLYAEPLVHAAATIETLRPSILREAGGSIYYGTGLTTRKALSVGVPFDILTFVLVAEKLRRTLGFRNIYHTHRRFARADQ